MYMGLTGIGCRVGSKKGMNEVFYGKLRLVKRETGGDQGHWNGEARIVAPPLWRLFQYYHGGMKNHTAYLTFRSRKQRDYINITEDVEQALEESGIREGMALVEKAIQSWKQVISKLK